MINPHESMGLGQNQTRNPWMCSQTRICRHVADCAMWPPHHHQPPPPPTTTRHAINDDCVDALRPSQQFFSHVGMISCFPDLKQWIKCLAQWHNTVISSESGTSNSQTPSIMLYQLSHCASAQNRYLFLCIS